MRLRNCSIYLLQNSILAPVFCNIFYMFFLGLIVSSLRLILREDSHLSGTSSWKQETMTKRRSFEKSQRLRCLLKDENNSPPPTPHQAITFCHPPWKIPKPKQLKWAKYHLFTEYIASYTLGKIANTNKIPKTLGLKYQKPSWYRFNIAIPKSWYPIDIFTTYPPSDHTDRARFTGTILTWSLVHW